MSSKLIYSSIGHIVRKKYFRNFGPILDYTASKFIFIYRHIRNVVQDNGLLQISMFAYGNKEDGRYEINPSSIRNRPELIISGEVDVVDAMKCEYSVTIRIQSNMATRNALK